MFKEYDIKVNFSKDSIVNKDAIKNKKDYLEFVKELNLIIQRGNLILFSQEG